MTTVHGPDRHDSDHGDATELAATRHREAAGAPERGLELRERLALADDPTETQRVEWICLDQIRAWQAGIRIPAEAYLALQPPIPTASEAAFEVVYSEFLVRESMGEAPRLDELAWRFPHLADRLARQIAFHRILTTDEDGAGDPATHHRPLSDDGEEDDGPTIADAPRVPGYRLLGELGRGGAGVVYKARQRTLNRLVALKVIQSGRCTSPWEADRFRSEAEATARLQHPNIIQVHEVGEYEGHGFLALEYAAGGSLEAAIAGTPWAPIASAALLEELAGAIHHAHEQGIVHRDLKPANVVMTSNRTPKITDFGLAKLLERNDGSMLSGTIRGTPSYMAPEQVLGPSDGITPAADVYALGAILYELLTGRPPFKGATPLATLDQVANHEPVPPGSLQRNIPADLETICMKCLEKSPSRRYATAQAFADDLRRFLDGRTILARPSPFWEKGVKWGRRRPALTCALGGLAAAVVVMFAGILYYNALLRAGVRTARAAKAEADRSARVALEQRNLALKSLDKLVFEVQEGLGETPSTRSLRRSLLDTAIAGLDEIAFSAESASSDLSRAVAHQKLGEIYRQVGRSTEGARQLEQAVQLAEQLTAAAPEDLAVKECLSRSHVGLGEIHLRADRIDLALGHFHRVVELAREITAAADRPSARRGLLDAYVRLGRAHGFHGDYDEARGWFLKSLALAEQWRADAPSDAEASRMLAWSYRKIADMSKLSGDLDAARVDYLKAIAVGRENLKTHPADIQSKTHLAAALDDLAGVLPRPEAKALYQEAETLFAEAVAADPDNAEVRVMLVHVQYHQAKLQYNLAHFSEAASTYRRAVATLNRIPREALSAPAPNDFLRIEVLQRELADCEALSNTIRP